MNEGVKYVSPVFITYLNPTKEVSEGKRTSDEVAAIADLALIEAALFGTAQAGEGE